MPISSTSSSFSSPGRRPVGLWRTVLGCEWRLVRSDAGIWLTGLLLLTCVAYALLNGQQRVAERSASVSIALADQSERLQGLRQQLLEIEAGRAKPPSQPWRDPTNPIGVGRGSAAAIVHWSDAPLAATAVGLADLYPASFRVGVGSRERFLFADEIANPLQLATGSFDLVFVVVYLLPLLLVALSYNVMSGEREQGTWALSAASSAPPLPILLAKLLLRGGIAVGALLLFTAAGLCLLGAPLASAQAAGALAAWTVTLLLYAGFWLALALWVNSWHCSSAFNALALVMAWVLLVLLLPALISATAQALYPAPSRAEVVLAVREAAVDADRDRAAEQARFSAEHGLATPANSGAANERHALLLTLTADRRADAVLARHEALVRQQRALTDRLGLLSPALLVNDTLTELGGNGHSQWDAYLSRVDAFHTQWQAFFVERAQAGLRLSSADLERLPRYDEVRASIWAPGAAGRMLSTWTVLALALLGLMVLARRGLRRVD